jgi:hypothetical protein
MLSKNNLLFFAILLISSFLIGCKSKMENYQPPAYIAWSGPELSMIHPPRNFSITPQQAEEIADAYYQKHAPRHIYNSKYYYYVCTKLYHENSIMPVREGLKIDGKNGDIYDAQSKSWMPCPLSKEELKKSANLNKPLPKVRKKAPIFFNK